MGALVDVGTPISASGSRRTQNPEEATMIRPVYALTVVAALVLACDSTSTPTDAAAPPGVTPQLASASANDGPGPGKIVSFGAMYGVDEAFVNHRQIRDVLGDELPWEVGRAEGTLWASGRLVVHVRGIVFADVPEVPPELRGINDETQFRALVSCLVPGADRV